MKSLITIIKYFVWGLWRLFQVIIGAILFFGAWFWPMYYYLGEDNAFADLWVLTYGFIVFYGISMWHVISEDQREVSVWIKMRTGILVSFNKMLFAFIALAVYVLIVGTLNGEL